MPRVTQHNTRDLTCIVAADPCEREPSRRQTGLPAIISWVHWVSNQLAKLSGENEVLEIPRDLWDGLGTTLNLGLDVHWGWWETMTSFPKTVGQR